MTTCLLTKANREGRPAFDIADIVRLHLPALKMAQPLSSVQGRALAAITLCRTVALGGHVNLCPDCGPEDPSYNSCRNRNCPKCQALAQQRWIAARALALLPIPHFHGVFTLPEEFRPLARAYPREIYNALFRCASAALLELGQTRLGATLGLTLVLHTWTRALLFHPHVHVLISAGGLSLDGSEFLQVEENFLLHVVPLAELFKKNMMEALRQIRSEGGLPMTDGAFDFLTATLANQKWNVYLKRAFHSPAAVLEYIGRYTHRVGISNSRILDVTPETVTFRTKDGRAVTLHPVIFLQRFVQHVLPDRFKKIRHAGLYASPKALAKAKGNLGDLPIPAPIPPTWQEAMLELTGRDVTRCSHCGARLYQGRIRPQRHLARQLIDQVSRSPP